MKILYRILVIGLLLIAPFIFPEYRTQLSFLWVMIIFALTWDIIGGQMGYNSFGNILFFGIGVYTCAVFQRDSGLDYFSALFIGMALGGLFATVAAIVFGKALLDARGHYFAIGTLGLGVAAGEIAAGWDYIGAGSGMSAPLFPGDIQYRDLFFYYVFLLWAGFTLYCLHRLYRTRFGLALNAIRDDEDKAEAMGLHTSRYKIAAWCLSAFFLAVAGGAVGNLIGFIDPKDVAFAGSTYGVWMILMAIAGGRGTLWGPVIGAVLFHFTQEIFWIYLLGWQRVALGVLIIVVVIYFPVGVLGWLRQRWPHRFAAPVDTQERSDQTT